MPQERQVQVKITRSCQTFSKFREKLLTKIKIS